MTDTNDRRRNGQDAYLKNKILYRRAWKSRSTEHDHDHCESCGEKFSASRGDLCEGYTTGDSAENPHLWICPTCFRDFREAFGFTLEEAEPGE